MVQALLERKEWMLCVLEKADYVVSPSRFLRDRLVENGVPAGKIVVSAHGIETDWTQSVRQVRRPSDHLRFAFIGMMGWHKGAHIALQAFNDLERPNGATLTLYGNNQHFADYFRRLSLQIDRNPLIIYGGCFPHSQIGEVLSGVDALIMPSMWYENTPVIMYEAFATKTPVIATHEGGMAELIDEFEGGWTFPRGDVDALAALMQHLIDHPQQVSEASEQIRPVRTIGEHVVDLMTIFEQACGGREG
jgi:glycosyltransferase involved in cell wall biosynthesis